MSAQAVRCVPQLVPLRRRHPGTGSRPPYDHCDQRSDDAQTPAHPAPKDPSYRVATERLTKPTPPASAQVLTQTAAATDTHGPPPDPNDDPPPF